MNVLGKVLMTCYTVFIPMKEPKPGTSPSVHDQKQRDAEILADRQEIADRFERRLAAVYLRGQKLDPQEMYELIRDWRLTSPSFDSKPFPNTERTSPFSTGVTIDYVMLHQKYPELYRVLETFASELRHFRNADHSGSHLVPTEYFTEAKIMYEQLATKVVQYIRRLSREGGFVEQEFLTSVDQEAKMTLQAFHQAVDAYPVAEDLLELRHPDLAAKILEDFYYCNNRLMDSEAGAVMSAKALLARLFKEEYEDVLRETLAEGKGRLTKQELEKKAAISNPIFEKYRTMIREGRLPM